MKGSAGQLKSEITQIHEQFCTTGQDLVDVLGQLDTMQEERENTRRVVEAAKHCKRITELMTQVRKQISNEEHYGAMHTIEQIQQEQNKILVASLSKLVGSWLPIVKNQILDGAKTGADGFLSDQRNDVALVGTSILRRQASLYSQQARRQASFAGTIPHFVLSTYTLSFVGHQHIPCPS